MTRYLDKRLLSIIFIVIMIVGVVPFSVAAADNNDLLFNDRYLITQTEYPLANGITEYETITNNQSGLDQNIDYFCEINPNVASAMVMTGFPDYDPTTWKMEDIVEQAEDAQRVFDERDNNYRVVAILNADFYNMATGEPNGALVLEGKEYHSANGRSYFGITKDGEAVVRNGNVSLNDMEMAVGGASILLMDGSVKVPADGGGHLDLTITRTAVGVKKDGTVVTMVCHGNNYPVSGGYTFYEVACMLKARGCTSAIMLDGSGSSQYASIHEGEEEMVLRNSPSDGMARQVSSSILLVTSETSSGIFDHASVSPNNEIYTPGYCISFKATGSDYSGAPADLPQDGQWRIADTCTDMGQIDPNTGVFTGADGKTGEVTVEYVVNDSVSGTSKITFDTPDNIYFQDNKISVGLGETTDLGLLVKTSNRNINYKDGDFSWELSDSTMGTIVQNKFTANPTEGKEGTVTVTSAYNKDLSATISVEVGKAPLSIMDFEDFESDGDVIEAEDYWSIGKAVDGSNVKLYTANYDRGGKESAQIVNREDGSPVRFGDHSLKLNYDFANGGNGPTGTEGACLGMSAPYKLPDEATGLGIWVYTPEDTPNLWFRMRYEDGNERVTQLDFTPQPAQAEDNIGGLAKYSGEGWQYFEASLDGIARPISIPSGELARVMFVPGLQMGTTLADGTKIPVQDCCGSIYLDNLMVVFGSNPADTNAPIISSATVNDLSLSDGLILDNNSLDVIASFTDESDLFETGVDTNKVYLYLDGNRLEQASTSSVGEFGGVIRCNGITLSNGIHTIKIVATDKYGNERIKSYTIEVNAPNNASLTVETSKVESVILGGDAEINFNLNDFSAVDQIEFGIKLDKNYKNSCTVIPAEGFEVTAAPNYDIIHKILRFTVKNTEKVEGNGTFATLKVNICSTLGAGSTFSYMVQEGNITYAEGYTGKDSPYFGSVENRIPVNAPYTIESDTFVVGMSNQSFIITDTKTDEPAIGIKLYQGNDLLGTSDSSGLVNYEAKEAGHISVVAEGDNGNKSFAYNAICCTPAGTTDGLPDFIHFGSSKTPETTKVVTWVSNPVTNSDAQLLRLAKTKEMTDAQQFSANTSVLTFTGDLAAVQTNTVTLNDLDPSSTYYYQVGNSEIWSDVHTLHTISDDGSKEILVFGDIQEYEDEETSSILEDLSENSFDLLIQVGDIVDAGNRYDNWRDIMVSMGDTNGMDNFYVVGNHEVEGDVNAQNALGLFGIDNHRNSVTYGDVYIGTIPYHGNTTQYEDDLEWLSADTLQSDAIWKIWVIHQAPYYTNPMGGNEAVHELVPKYAQGAGVDMVLSGHDHTYARTRPMIDGKVNEDGITYLITGAVGNKRYTPHINDSFNFDYYYDIPSTTAIYTTLKVDSGSMNSITMNAYEYDISTRTSKSIDSFSLEKECVHHFVYDGDELKCTKCGEKKSLADLTGFVDAKDGLHRYYFYNGKYKTDWFTVGEDIYHAGKDGIIHKTETYSTATCREDGYLMARCLECDIPDYKGGLKRYTGHTWDENHICKVCGWKGVDISTLDGRPDYPAVSYKGNAYRPYIWIYDKDGNQLKAGSTYADFIPYYENNVEVGTSTIHIEGYGDYYGERTMNFEIRPQNVDKFSSVERTEDGFSLKWKASLGAEKYLIYCSDKTSKWPKWIEVDGTEYVIPEDDIDPTSAVVYRLRPFTEVDGDKRYYSMNYSVPITLCPSHQYVLTKDTPATCEQDGEKVYTCNLCKDVKTEVIPKLGHDFSTEFTIDKPATQWEDGIKSKHCSRCDARSEITVIPRLGSSGGGGSTTPSKPEPTPTPVKPNPPKIVGNTTKVQANIEPDVQGNIASVTVDKELLNTAIENAAKAAKENKTEANIELKLDPPKIATEVNISLPTEVIKNLSKNDASLTLSSPIVDVELPKEVLEVIKDQGGNEEITIQMEAMEPRDLNPEQQAVLGKNSKDAIILSLNISSADKKISNFGSSATVSIPYTPKAKEDTEKLVVWFVADDGVIAPCEGRFNAETGKFDFVTDHFSNYVLVSFPFTDISKDKWFYGGAAYCYNNGLMSGTSTTSFEPNTVISRAMLATVLYRMEETPIVNFAMTFTDVPQDTYYTEAVRWAASAKIVDGYSAEIFAPADNLTREQMVTMLWRYAESPILADYNGLSKYSDRASISDFAVSAMQWAHQKGIISGTSDTILSPQGTATRAQFAVILQRFMHTK